MPADRFYTTSSLEGGKEAFLTDQELHHLSHVTRSGVGDQVELIDGRGSLAQAEITQVKRKQATLNILSVHKESPPTFPLIIAQAIPRLNRLETIVEKCTELGMTELWLFAGKRSEKKELKDGQLDRLQKIAVSATKQSGRLFFPNIKQIPFIEKWDPQALPLFFGDIDPKAPTLLQEWNASPPKKGLIFAIGPESGFNEDEDTALKAVGGRGVKLHKNVLRTDTAPIAALSVIAQCLL